MNLGWTYNELGQTATALTCYQRSLARCHPNQPIARKLQALVVRGLLAIGKVESECLVANGIGAAEVSRGIRNAAEAMRIRVDHLIG